MNETIILFLGITIAIAITWIIAYQEAVSKLSKGSGHLVGQAEKLRKLGLDVNKKIPEKFISDSDSD